ncbi:DUF2066 domain-containing protein [Vibrio mangrovi]|uniref:DUF2066 domain-containing protein n=1 Tax=Vibrio mangrovi TaxID=474394 RepID=A0A1Y6IVB1_9VIBR|nr:DUF2066 domain-containing protein [Vibrio mangrovi]MDW6001544.1 DUF2066 domain-containing protein [Vibrio mangrovi]SMS00432.1 hypothetical protein VIM7927_01698 [Vibrio mangrovi]
MRNFACLILLCLNFSGYAATQVNIYRSEVVLAPEQNEAQARVQGMENVIIRATGDRNSVDNPVVKKALSQNRLYLSQISYDQKDEQNVVKMQFGSKQIRTLLTQAQLPFWPEKRATILVWYVEDQNFQRNIAWENVANSDIQQLKQLAEERGLPLIVPVGDFDDITGIEASDVWGGFLQPIRDASRRYHPDAILIVRAQSGELNWKLYDQSPENLLDVSISPVSGNFNGEHAQEQLVDQLTQYYARKNRVIVSGESSHSMLLKVTHLSRAVHFFTLEQALNQLSSVAAVDVVNVQGDEVTFRVHLLTTQEEFEQELTSVSLIERQPSPVNSETGLFEQPHESAPAGEQTENVDGLSGNSETSSRPDIVEKKSESETNSSAAPQPTVYTGVSQLIYQWRENSLRDDQNSEEMETHTEENLSTDNPSQSNQPQDN